MTFCLFFVAAAAKPLFGAPAATTSPFAAPAKPAFSFAGGAAGGGLFGASAPAQARKTLVFFFLISTLIRF